MSVSAERWQAAPHNESPAPELHLAPAAPLPSTARPTGRRIGAYAGIALLVALLIPAGLWTHFQATHLVSRNALLRAHLADLGVRGEGVIARVHVDAGDRVSQGEILVTLEDSHLRARRLEMAAALATLDEEIELQQAELDLALRAAGVSLARADAAREQRLAELRAATRRAEEAEEQYRARQALARDGVISSESLRESETRAVTAVAGADAAQAAAAGAQQDVRAATLERTSADLLAVRLRVLKARREQTRARLLQVDADIDAMQIRAPADGAIVRRLAQPGMAVDTATPVLSMWLEEDTWVEAWVPEEGVGALREGDPVQVSFPALPGDRFDGRIARIGLATDFEMPVDYLPQSREERMRPTPLIGVAVRIDALPQLLRPGMSAVVTLPRSDS